MSIEEQIRSLIKVLKIAEDPLSILCYGDSNTWGLEALTFRRFGAQDRWTGVTQREMGEGFKILEEGLSGRTTTWDDPLCSWLPPNDDPSICNGRKSLMPILHSAKPVSVVVLALGANDMKSRFHLSPPEIAKGIAILASKIQQAQAGIDGHNPEILIVCPPPCTNESFFPDLKGARAKSYELPACYQNVAEEHHCHFLDAGSIEGVVCDSRDGIHLTKEAHHRLGVAIADKLKKIIFQALSLKTSK